LIPTFFITRPALTQPPSGCPSGNEAAREVVEAYLSDSGWADERQEAGISVSPREIRLSSDAQDPDVCQQLTDGISNTEWLEHFFYEAGPYYFDVSTLRPSSEWPEDDVPGVKPGLMIYD